MVREFGLGCALLALNGSANAKDVVVRGRVVTHRTRAPIERALVQLFDECPEGLPRESESKSLGRTITDGQGKFELEVVTERSTACLYSWENHHMAARKEMDLATVDVDAGDLALKPLARGTISLAGFVDQYSIYAARSKSEEDTFFTEFTTMVGSDATNLKAAESEFLADKAFRKLLEARCKRDSRSCEPIRVHLEQWRTAVAKDEKGSPR